jgi:hypothetical protein
MVTWIGTSGADTRLGTEAADRLWGVPEMTFCPGLAVTTSCMARPGTTF